MKEKLELIRLTKLSHKFNPEINIKQDFLFMSEEDEKRFNFLIKKYEDYYHLMYNPLFDIEKAIILEKVELLNDIPDQVSFIKEKLFDYIKYNDYVINKIIGL
jgi:hypothetical protein